MRKQTRIQIRVSEDDKDAWNLYSLSIGYESLSEFIRDSINGLIKSKKKPRKTIIIK